MESELIIASLCKTIEELVNKIAILEAELTALKNKKNSTNSHLPPSQDPHRAKKNQSLREPTDRKVGGQPGHKGTTLTCSKVIDVVVKHIPAVCDCCQSNLTNTVEEFVNSRQLIDIPPIALEVTEHRVYKKQCSCGHTTVSVFPKHVANPVQYGPNVESLIAYLHTRQHLPFKRTAEFLNDVMGLPISTGGINNVLNRFAQKALPTYKSIKKRIEQAGVVGTDETGINIDGKNNWAWVWQNNKLTYIVCAASRGFKTIKEVFENGLPNATLIHDRWACHFQTNAKAHQMCTAHLLRDLNYINELYKDKCVWAKEFKALLLQAINLKKELNTADYFNENKTRDALFKKLSHWLNYPIDEEHKKAKTLQKKLLAKQDAILYFLLQADVVPDNNGSERAIRNIKVKQKISGQFKTLESANVFAVLRSIIDTAIKNGCNVLNTLRLIATFGTE